MATQSIKYYKNNTGLKAADQVISYTPDQIEEYLKCSSDPIYFIENYVKIVSLDDGIVLFKLHSYQKRMIDAIHNNTRIIGKLFRQGGKCVCNNSIINIRNKKTGEIQEISIGDFYNLCKDKANNDN
jgi:hypothetical protein